MADPKPNDSKCFKHGNDPATCPQCAELRTKDYSDHAEKDDPKPMTKERIQELRADLLAHGDWMPFSDANECLDEIERLRSALEKIAAHDLRQIQPCDYHCTNVMVDTARAALEEK